MSPAFVLNIPVREPENLQSTNKPCFQSPITYYFLITL
jgi:hypothetical protein